MAPQTISIDLGELSREEPPAPPTPWPGWRHLRSRLGRKPVWLGLATVLTLLTVVMVTAAVPQRGPAIAPLLSVRANSVFWDDEYFYAIDRPDLTRGFRITAHRWVDGSVAWQSLLSNRVLNAWLTVGNGLLLLTTSASGAGARITDTLTRLDPLSGRPLWDVEGMLWEVAGDRVLIQRRGSDSELEQRGIGTDLVAVDAATGTDAWQLHLAGWGVALDPAGSGRLVTLDIADQLRSYDLDSGELLASVTVGVPLDQPTTTELSLHQPSSTALVRRQVGATFTLTGYETTTLERRWTIAESSTGYRDGTAPWPLPCGPLLCLDDRDGFPRGLDPHNGEVVWVADWLEPGYVSLGLHGGFLAQELPVLDGHLVASSPGGLARSWVIDAASGEEVLELGGWQLQQEGPTDPRAPLLAVMVPDQLDPGRGPTLIGRVRPDLTAVDLVGAIDGRYGWCFPGSGRYVLCQADAQAATSELDVTVWLIG